MLRGFFWQSTGLVVGMPEPTPLFYQIEFKMKPILLLFPMGHMPSLPGNKTVVSIVLCKRKLGHSARKHLGPFW